MDYLRAAAMRKAPLFYVLLAIIALLLNSDSTLALNEADSNGYPLNKGNTWTYKGSVKWTSENEGIRKDKVTSTMEVVDTIKKGSVEIAKIKGSPGSLKLSQAGKTKETEFENVVTDANENHQIIRNSNQIHYYDYDIDNEIGSVILDLPLTVGKSFGNISTVKRSDGLYCWVVKEEKNVDLTPIKGLEKFGVRSQYTLVFATLADDTEVDFVPDVGVTGYRYKHHGSVEEYDMILAEAKI